MSKKRIVRDKAIEVYENRFLRLYDDEVTFPSGDPGHYVRIKWNFPYSVGIVPVSAHQNGWLGAVDG